LAWQGHENDGLCLCRCRISKALFQSLIRMVKPTR
jgi:hypothetical protein